MAHLDRIGWISNGRSNERLLHRPMDFIAVLRPDIPGSRSDDLVIFNLAVLDHDPVRQRTRAASVEPKPFPDVSSSGLV